MQILFYTQVSKVKNKEDSDFTHDEVMYRFRNRKMNQAIDYFSALIDRIDNDYTGDPAPYYACVYFGYYDSNCFSCKENYIEHDTEILFVREGFEHEDMTTSTRKVSKDVDMDDFQCAYEMDDFCDLWLDLYERLGAKVMNGAYACTGGNNIIYDKKEILEMKAKYNWWTEKVLD